MAKFVPLNKPDHAEKTWTRKEDYRFSARDALVPLVGSEVAAAACDTPVGFVWEDNKYTLVALLSFKTDENLFVSSDGKWLGRHVPLVLRSHPFRLLRTKGADGMTLCVDEASDSIGLRVVGDALFDTSGSPSKAVMDVLDFLKRFEGAIRAITEMAVAALCDAKVIVPWPIKITGGPSEASVNGLYRIDEKALNDSTTPRSSDYELHIHCQLLTPNFSRCNKRINWVSWRRRRTI